MDKQLRQLYSFFVHTIIKSDALTAAQISYMYLVEGFDKTNCIDVALTENWISNDHLLSLGCDINPQHFISKIPLNAQFDQSLLPNYAKNGYLKFNIDEDGYLVIYNLRILSQIKYIKMSTKIRFIQNQDFLNEIGAPFNTLNISWSKYSVDYTTEYITAKNISYTKSIVGAACLLCITILINVEFFQIFCTLLYFVHNVMKLSLFTIIGRKNKLENAKRQNAVSISFDRLHSFDALETLPIYSILVPLYREISKVHFIIHSIDQLNYPKDKLDVKLIVEACDQQLLNVLHAMDLPMYMQIIVVPFAIPMTKPKALNFGLTYCKGEYVTVYDAEDVPDPNQLLIAIRKFHDLPQEYACLQAKLNFYNQDDNLLTKFMSLEYSIWFEYLLNGLSTMQLPVPLGGTSNHFKVVPLISSGGWDAYNVTEDADLGIRLHANGYKTAILDSYTMEECPNNLRNWLLQRARWIKGFIQTFLVFYQNINKYNHLSFKDRISIYVFLGLTPYSFLVTPWLFLYHSQSLVIQYCFWCNVLFSICYFYYTVSFVLLYHKRHISFFNKTIYQITIEFAALVLWPLYFVLHIIASYIAIFDVMFRPFYWYKTLRND